MADIEPSEPKEPYQIVEIPASITVFGVLNLVVGCYFLARIGYGWYRFIEGFFKSPFEITWGMMLFLLLGIVGVGLAIWLIALGVGLLTMRKWARRGSIMYARIQIVFMVITLGGIFILLIRDWQNILRVIQASINLNNAIALTYWIYMVLLLVLMKTRKVKRAFGE